MVLRHQNHCPDSKTKLENNLKMTEQKCKIINNNPLNLGDEFGQCRHVISECLFPLVKKQIRKIDS